MCDHDRTTRGPLLLTRGEIEQFHREGWIGPFTLRPPEQMEALRAELEPLLDDPKGAPWANLTMDAHMISRAVLEIGSDPAVVERIADLIGDDVLLWRAWTFSKRPGAPATGVHRDGRIDQTWPTVSGPVAGVPVLAIWVSLDGATPENGCLWAFPRTQYIRWDQPREERIPAVDFAMFPTQDFLGEYGLEVFQLGRFRISRRTWRALCGLLRVVGLLQRSARAVVRVLSPTRRNTFRSPPLTGLTRDEQRLFAGFVGPNVNRVTLDALAKLPLPKVPLVCKPGEFYIFREDLIHAAPGNTTAARRGAITFGYAAPVVQIHPDRFPVLVHGHAGGGNRLVTPSFDGAPPTAGADAGSELA